MDAWLTSYFPSVFAATPAVSAWKIQCRQYSMDQGRGGTPVSKVLDTVLRDPQIHFHLER